jgi:hypothetical protein
VAAAQRARLAVMPALTIPSRFCGPPGSGNGGYVRGRIAAYIEGPVTVTLRQPPPLATAMAVEPDGESALRVQHGRTLIAEATSSSASPAPEIPGPVSTAEARTAAGRARYYQDPVFSACFVCGTDRQPGDGLRIFPGPLAGRRLWAAPWTPDLSVADADGRLRPEVVWAALEHAADIVTILLPPAMPWCNIEATLLAGAPGAPASRPQRAPAFR